MDITVFPGKLAGSIKVIPAKSYAHRILICAAFADKSTHVNCDRTSEDIQATVGCLCALGADITAFEWGYAIHPVKHVPRTATLNCGESGSTLRFLLPVVGALGVDATFHMEGRLPQRPLSPLWELMESSGCILTRPTASTIRCQGKLRAGEYTIDGSVSSQFITGLMIALTLISGKCDLKLTGKAVSQPYIEMTRSVLRGFGVKDSSKKMHSSGAYTVEGDWSNGAFFMAANMLGSQIRIDGLEPCSLQADSAFPAVANCLTKEFTTIDAANFPDLIPILSVLAVCHHGARFTSTSRLRGKESDRVSAICNMLSALGTEAFADEDSITVYPGKLSGGTVDACADHRIAMAASIAATVAGGPVTILGADCVKKSYPSFWKEFARLGGKYE